MEYIIDGFKKAFFLIFSGNMEIYKVIGLSLFVSLTSVAIATLISVPVGILTGLKDFYGKATYSKLLYTFMGMPPVVLGLFVALLVSRRGPIGHWMIYYTPTAMIIAQTLLVLPIIMGNIFNHVKNLGKEIQLSCQTLGAGKWYTLWVLIKELRIFILIAVVTGFGRAISEVGAVMLVGGNIRDKTRTMTTVIAMNNGMGNYAESIAMGFILLLLAFFINSLLYKFIMGANHD